jgi:hypothetical protein
VASDITDEMIAAGARAMRYEGFVDWDDDTVPTFNDSDVAGTHLGSRIASWVPPEQVVRAVLEAALAGRTVVEPDWAVVESAVARGIADHAAAYAIPANQLAGGDREQERRMAESWGKTMAPHVTACIREDLRKAASGSVGSETPAGDLNG